MHPGQCIEHLDLIYIKAQPRGDICASKIGYCSQVGLKTWILLVDFADGLPSRISRLKILVGDHRWRAKAKAKNAFGTKFANIEVWQALRFLGNFLPSSFFVSPAATLRFPTIAIDCELFSEVTLKSARFLLGDRFRTNEGKFRITRKHSKDASGETDYRHFSKP